MTPSRPTRNCINQHLARVQLWQKLQTDHAHLQRLQSAYLLRVYVAGSAGTSQLLPEMAAAALLEPLRDDEAGSGRLRASPASPASPNST